MDHFDSQTLGEFTKNYGSTLSLMTKLLIMFSLVQGVRQLRENHVVHLDLKPSNILMHPKMMIKIIDFGESYHPKAVSSGIYVDI